MINIGYFAAGIIMAWILWIATGYIRAGIPRTALRAISTAILVTPAVLAGHGIGVLPAYLLLFDEKYIWWGIVPIASIAVILLIVFFSVKKIRQDRIKDKITWNDILIRPARFKLFLIGLIIVLLMAEFRGTVDDLWVVQFLIFATIISLHLILCYAVQQDKPQSSAFLPIWFIIPHAIYFYPAAVLYYLGGLAGCFAGKRNYSRAYLTGLIGSGIAGLMFGQQLYSAIRYAGVQHIKIQGGISGSAILFAVVIVVFIYCLMGFWKYHITSKHPDQ